MKTNKRSFWLTLALVAMCVCAAFVFVSCGDKETPPPAPHEHEYTEWKHTDDEHWRECPADGAATEKSKHTFVDGRCECGLIDTRTFGTVTGKVTLRGGKNATDYSDVTVDFEGDDVNVDMDESGNFTASHVTVGKDYDVTVSKEGYSSYTAFVGLDTEGETVALATPFTLEYKRFDLWAGYDSAQHDFSHVNDDEPTIGNNGATLNVITRDTYDNVATSLWMKKGNSTHVQDVQGIFVKFEDGKYMFARCENIDKNESSDYKLQWAKNFDGSKGWGGKTSVIEEWNDFQKPLTPEQAGKFDGEGGLKVTVLRRGGTLYTYADDALIQGGTMMLPAEYGDDRVQVGFFAYDSKANASWKFAIEEDIDAYEKLLEDIAAPDVTAVHGAVSFDKKTYKYGERATVTVTPDDGYILSSLDVYGKSVSAEVENDMYSFAVTGTIEVTATFIPSTQFDSVTFTTPAAANANGLKITLSRDGESDKTGTVTDNAFTVTDIKPGLWHAKTAQYGVDVALKDVFVGAETVALDMSGVFGSADAIDFGNVKTYSGGDATFYTVPANISGDAYFAMKVKCATDITTAKPDSIQFGLQLFYEGQGEASMRFTVKNNNQNNGGYYKMQQSNLWDEENVAETYVNALKNDGLYVVVYRETDTGNVYVYYGTSKNNIVKSNKVYGSGDKKKGNIIKFGVGFWTGNYNAAIGDLRYGTTMAEALGEQVTPIVVNGTGDVMDGQTKQGSISVANANVYEDVIVTIAEAAGYKLSGFTVNNVSIPLSSLTATGNGTYSYKIGCYTSSELSVGATFVDYLVRDVTLTVNGHKMGETVAFNGEVTLTNVADSTDVHKVTLTNGTVTVRNMVTPATYKVSFDTANYNEGQIKLEKGDTTASVSLEYKRFDLWKGYDPAQHDFSRVNDAQPVIGNNGKTLNAITRDSYDSVATSLWVKTGNGTTYDLQGIFIQFEDGKCMKLTYVNGGWLSGQGLLWHAGKDWDKVPINESAIKFKDPLDSDCISLLGSGDGLKVTLLRKGGMLYVYANDSMVAEGAFALPEGYADDKVQVGFFTFGSKTDASWKFAIEEDIASYAIPNYTVPTVSVTNGTVSFDKTTYAYGERATVTITPDNGFILDTLTVCGENVTSQVSNNAYSFAVTKDITFSATFKDYLLKDVAVTVNGHKMGENVALNGEVTLTNAMDSSDVHKVTLTNGTVTVQNMVTPATYKVSFDTANYNEGQIKLEKGATTASVSLEYKRFNNWYGWAAELHDFSAVNNEQSEIKFGNTDKTDQHVNVITRDAYDDVSVSLWMKDSVHPSNKVEGIFLKFENGKYMFLRSEAPATGLKLQWMADLGGGTFNGVSTPVAKADWVNFQDPLTAGQKTLFDGAGLKVTVVRIDNVLYTMVDDALISGGTMTLDSEYVTQKVQVGYWIPGSKANTTWSFDIHSVDNVDTKTFENVTFKVDPAFGANGKTVTLSRDGETDITATIANNVFTVPSIKGGLWHAKTTVYGIEVATDDVWVESTTAGIAFSAVFGAGKSIGDVTHVSGSSYYTVPVDISGDAYFGLKLTCTTDVTTLANDAVRFGLSLKYESGEASMTLVSKGANGFRLSEMNLNWDSDWLTAYQASVKSGLYMVVHVEQTTGKAYVYFGTAKDSMTLFKTFDANDKRKGKIVQFGAGFWNGSYDATISNLMYGTSLESLGYSVAG